MLKDFLENRKMYVDLHHKKNIRFCRCFLETKAIDMKSNLSSQMKAESSVRTNRESIAC